MNKMKGWKSMLPGGCVNNPGNSEEYLTGAWRSARPVWDEKKCIQCFRCWSFCPDCSIIIKDGKVAGINYDYCKGCGICAYGCPPKAKALEMQSERK